MKNKFFRPILSGLFLLSLLFALPSRVLAADITIYYDDSTTQYAKASGSNGVMCFVYENNNGQSDRLMSKVEGDIYKVSVPDNAKVIFKNTANWNDQSVDVEKVLDNHLYKGSGKDNNKFKVGDWGDYTVKVNGKINIYVKSTTAPYIYVWDINDTYPNGGWPGGVVTKTESVGTNDYYKLELTTDVPVSAILNTGGNSPVQTSDIPGIRSDIYLNWSGGTGYEIIDNPGGDVGEYETEITIWYDNSGTNYTKPVLYYWEPSTVNNTMTKVNDNSKAKNLYKAENVPNGSTVIFKDDSTWDTQSNNFDGAKNNHLYIATSTEKNHGIIDLGLYEEFEYPGDDLYLIGDIKDLGTTSNDGLKLTGQDDGSFKAEDVEFVKSGGNASFNFINFLYDNADVADVLGTKYGPSTATTISSFENPFEIKENSSASWSIAPGKYDVIVNLNSKQLTIVDKNAKDPEPDPDPESITVYVYGETAPYLYAWSGSGEQTEELNGEWPGTQLTETETVGNNSYWKKTFDRTEAFNVILNSGHGGYQTADINVTKDVYLNYNGGHAHSEVGEPEGTVSPVAGAPEPITIYYDDVNTGYASKGEEGSVYVHYFSSDNSKVEGLVETQWPGIPMSLVNEGIQTLAGDATPATTTLYSAQVPAGSAVIFNSGIKSGEASVANQSATVENVAHEDSYVGTNNASGDDPVTKAGDVTTNPVLYISADLINGVNGWGTDYKMTETNGVYTISNIDLGVTGFKIRAEQYDDFQVCSNGEKLKLETDYVAVKGNGGNIVIDADGATTIEGATVTFTLSNLTINIKGTPTGTIPTYPDALYVRSDNINGQDGWGTSDDNLMKTNDNDTYTLELSQLGKSFKLADAGYTYFNYGTNGTKLTLGQAYKPENNVTGDIEMDIAADYIENVNITFVLSTGELTVTGTVPDVETPDAADLYIVGNFNPGDWSLSLAKGLTLDETSGNYTISGVSLVDTGDGYSYFRFFEEPSWEAKQYGPAEDGTVVESGATTQMTVSPESNQPAWKIAAGTYDFEVNLSAMTFVATYKGEAGDPETPEVGTPDALFIVGDNINGVMDWGAGVELVKGADGLYTVTLNELGTNFKINDGSWTNGHNYGTNGEYLVLGTPYTVVNGANDNIQLNDGQSAIDAVYNATVSFDFSKLALTITGSTSNGNGGSSGINDIFNDDPSALVDVYDIAGHTLKVQVPQSEVRFMRPGVYILRQGNVARKVMVK